MEKTSKKGLPYVTFPNDKPQLEAEYVCWIDIMGMKSLLSRSVITATIIISRFQKLLNEEEKNVPKIKIYPVMDGAYLTCKNYQTLKECISRVYTRLAWEFIGEEKFYQKFIIKSCIAFGLIGHGEQVQNNDFSNKTSLVFGLPIIQAYVDEKKAPPFGIFIHQSARANANPNENSEYEPIPRRWEIWYSEEDEVAQKLWESLEKYYDKAKQLSRSLAYFEDNIEKHERMAKEYLTYWQILKN